MISSLLQNIQLLQSKGDQYFLPGHFRAYRYYSPWGLARPDDNLFYTALTLSVLKNIGPILNADQRLMVAEMIQRAQANYPLFSVEREGTTVYQFWREGQRHHFPYGRILYRFRKFKSPPDIDDTALAYLTYPHTSVQMAKVQEYVQPFSNGIRKWNPKLPTHFNLPKVYSTWMGSGAMPIEFDMVAMSNLLRAFHHYKLALNDYDEATLAYICLLIQSGYYLEEPFYAAPWYPSPIVIHYQMVKLWHETRYDQLEAIRPYLIAQLKQLKTLAQEPMEHILCQSSAMRLGIAADEGGLADWSEEELYTFVYSIGGMLTASTSKLSWRLAKHPLTHWHFKGMAFYWALILENIYLSSSRE
jgi:hypothetical protein